MTGRPLVAITGGTGFLGRHVVETMAAQGWRVRLLLRQTPAQPVATFPVETQRGDIADDTALRELVRGAQVVVHLAGLTKARRRSEFLAINRDGSARLAAAVAAVAPEARFILVSSLAAREPQLSAYAESKLAGEAAIAAELGEATRWVVLRPSVIYGPGDREGLALYRLAASRLIPALREPESRIALVHALDVAGAVAALCRSGLSMASFEVTDACLGGYGYRELLSRIGERLGNEPRFLRVPDTAILAAGAATDLWSFLTGEPAIFGRGKARELLHRNWASHADRQIPHHVWRPRIRLQQGLPATLAWWSSLLGEKPGTVGLPGARQASLPWTRPPSPSARAACLRRAALQGGASPRSGNAS